MRAKILFSAVAILNERVRLDSARIEGLTQAKVDLKTALALCENTVSNKEDVISAYKQINANNKKRARQRILYFGISGLSVGFVAGLLIR